MLRNIQRFKTFSDHRGDLTPIEFGNLPFTPQRVFLINNAPKGEVRGQHAHYKTQQFLFCVRGEVEVRLFNGVSTSTRKITSGEGIFVDVMIWDSQKFLTGQDVLLVLASTEYDKNDYIFDRQQFANEALEYLKKKAE